MIHGLIELFNCHHKNGTSNNVSNSVIHLHPFLIERKNEKKNKTAKRTCNTSIYIYKLHFHICTNLNNNIPVFSQKYNVMKTKHPPKCGADAENL